LEVEDTPEDSILHFLHHIRPLWQNPDYLELQKAEFQKLYLVDYILAA